MFEQDLIRPLLPDDVAQDLELRGEIGSVSQDKINELNRDLSLSIRDLLPQDVIDAVEKKERELFDDPAADDDS